MLSQTPLKTPGIQPLRIPFTQPFQPDPSCRLWLLPQQGGKWYDYSGHGNHGTIYGATWKPTPAGMGLYFDGTDDYVDCGSDSSLNITDEITVMAWFNAKYLQSGGDWSYIVTKLHEWDAGWAVNVETSGVAFIGYTVADGFFRYNSGSLNTDRFYLGTAVFDGQNFSLYIDGTLVNTGTTSVQTALVSSSEPVRIGYTGSEYFNGTIAEVLIYNRAWTADEIRRKFEVERCWFGV